jgi:hypothetical protein
VTRVTRLPSSSGVVSERRYGFRPACELYALGTGVDIGAVLACPGVGQARPAPHEGEVCG